MKMLLVLVIDMMTMKLKHNLIILLLMVELLGQLLM